MDVHLNLNMTIIRPVDGLQQLEYLKEFGDIYKRLEKRLEPVLVNQEQWKEDKTYLWHEDRIVVPSDGIRALLKWTHESSGHVGADRTLKPFNKWFHSTWSDDQLRTTLQPIVDKCPCWFCKRGDIRDRGLYLTLPIPPSQAGHSCHHPGRPLRWGVQPVRGRQTTASPRVPHPRSTHATSTGGTGRRQSGAGAPTAPRAGDLPHSQGGDPRGALGPGGIRAALLEGGLRLNGPLAGP